MLKIIEDLGSMNFPHPTSPKRRVVRVECECGTIKTVNIASFKKSRSCGCLQAIKIPIGEKYERLTIVEDLGRCVLPNTNTLARSVRCLCECGNEVTAQWSNIKHGGIKSCGCLQSETSKRNVKIMQEKNITHGDRRKENGRVRLYQTWSNIKARCYNEKHEKYKWYGGMGVEICQEWHDYINFKEWAIRAGYQNDLTIDRIDVTKNYQPDNCEWITAQENIDKEYTIDRDRRGRSWGGSYQ